MSLLAFIFNLSSSRLRTNPRAEIKSLDNYTEGKMKIAEKEEFNMLYKKEEKELHIYICPEDVDKLVKPISIINTPARWFIKKKDGRLGCDSESTGLKKFKLPLKWFDKLNENSKNQNEFKGKLKNKSKEDINFSVFLKEDESSIFPVSVKADEASIKALHDNMLNDEVIKVFAESINKLLSIKKGHYPVEVFRSVHKTIDDIYFNPKKYNLKSVTIEEYSKSMEPYKPIYEKATETIIESISKQLALQYSVIIHELEDKSKKYRNINISKQEYKKLFNLLDPFYLTKEGFKNLCAPLNSGHHPLLETDELKTKCNVENNQ
jgi:hypothetical protein